MYQGDAVAAVAADTEERAHRRGAARQGAVRGAAALRQRRAGDGCRTRRWCSRAATRAPGSATEAGDLDAGFKAGRAHRRSDATTTHVITHVCLETHGIVCEWDGDKLTAWVSTQGVHACAQRLRAGARDSAGQRPRDHAVHGRRLRQQVRRPAPKGSSARSSRRAAKAPVKLMLDRKEEHLDTGNRPSAGAQIKAGVVADGMLTAFDAQSWGTGGAGAGRRTSRCRTSTTSRIASGTHKDVYINAGSSAPMRAPGHPQGCFLTEILMDELADRVRMDPVEFRIKNLPPDAPNAMWRTYLPEGAKLFGWDKRHPTGDPTPGPIKTGLGCSVHQWGGGGTRHRRRTATSCPTAASSMKCGTQDIGTGTRTIVAMVTAETLGLPISAVKPEIGDTHLSVQRRIGRQHHGGVGHAGDSPRRRQGARRAVRESGADARRRPRDTLVAANGRIQVKDNPSKGLPGRTPASCSAPSRSRCDGAWQDGLSAVGHERRAVHRSRSRHRDRHRQGEAHPRDAGLRPGRRQAHRREPGLRRHHRRR